ncbi:uncharacterized protein LOC111081060 isoform X2 [Drosophila obscura]|uniref:uncharacterized protein LOC111081060 isoform X2 n=1 Tax=Drosophila obscura TaxID=7282 RepID=UPI001BB2215D|nr:uncharacterized protein LOC111081060 isoform X2 [Drosophila obscura]
MSDKRGFVLDAESMGLSSPETATTSGQQPAAQSLDVQQHLLAQQSQEAPQKNTGNDRKLCDDLKQCSSSLFDEENNTHSKCNGITEPIATEHYHRLLEKLPVGNGEATRINLELNQMFLNRLREIDSHDTQGGQKYLPLQLRLVTFQEWVDFLLHVNSVMFTNLSALEDEANEKVKACVQSVNGEQQQTLEDNRKLRKDLCAIIKLLQNAYHRDVWDTKNIELETLTVNQLLGITREQRHPESESEKMAECMKSLVNEMASKHDEACHLKSQLCALDEVVQTARQKLILKDQCIAQLNQRLQEITECLANVPQPAPFFEMPKDDVKKVGDMVASCILDNLSVKDKQESKILKILDAELNELLELHSRHEFQSMEACRNRLYAFFEKFSKELVEATRNLENVRNHLRALRYDANKPGSDPYTTPMSLVFPDPDGTSLESLRRHLQTFNNATTEMHGNYLRLISENNDLISRLKSESTITTRSTEILKGIADKFVEMGFSDFTYKWIYEASSTDNPFCDVINELYVKKKDDIALEEQQLLKTNQRLSCQISSLQEKLADRDAQVIELHDMIKSYSDFSENQGLKEEIYTLRQTHSAQQHKLRQMASLLKTREELREELCKQLEKLEGTYEEQCKELKKSKKRQQSLEESVCKGENKLEDITTERNLLREEISALKEKEAKAAGRERALCDQLKISQKELTNSRRVIQNLQDHVNQGQQKHREDVEQLKVANIEMNQQIREFESECKQMRGKLKFRVD